MHIFFVEGHSPLALGVQEYASTIRGIQCTLYDGDPEDTAELQRQLKELSADFVLNTYEFSDIRQVDQKPDKAWQINAIFPDHLAHICLETGAALIHISSDEVIGETRGIAFNETDTVHPINAYGESKWQGEEAIRQCLKRRLILRLGTLFDASEEGWLAQLVSQGKQQQSIQDASDVIVSPTAIHDASRVIIAMLQQMNCGADCWGTYQYAGVEAISRADFAEVALELAEDHGLIHGMADVKGLTAVALSLAGKQALRKEMSCQKIMDNFGIKQRSWRPALVECLEQFVEQEKTIQSEQATESDQSEESQS